MFAPHSGCMLLKEVGGTTVRVHNAERCKQAYVPCSTFKIPHALIALQTGVLTGPDHVIPWDGTKQPFPSWERDLDLADAIRVSAVPYFQAVARRIGMKRMRNWLKSLGYGNENPGAVIDRFWLDGPLVITAHEQLTFIERLYLDALPTSRRNNAVVRRMLVHQRHGDRVFSGKTGSDFEKGQMIWGWFVGHLRSGGREFVFVVNVKGAEGAAGSRARDVADQALRAMGL